MDTAVPRTRDKLSLLLIFIAILVAAGRALTTEWVPRLENVEILAALGLLLGFALGASRFSRRAVAWLAAAYSLVVVPWQLSKIVESAVSFEERLSGLGGRLLYSFIQLFSGQEVEDFVLFLAFISLVFWFLGLYAGYQITRHGKFLGAIIFAGFVIILIHTYDGGFPARINFLGVFLFFTLLLLGRLIYLREVQVWKTRHIVLPPETQVNFSIVLFVASAVLVFVAWNFPLSFNPSPAAREAWYYFSQPWDSFKERVSDAFAAIQSYSKAGGGDFYGERLGLGLGTSLSDEMVFVASIPQNARYLPRLYWQGMVYDKYDPAKGWSTTVRDKADMTPGDDILDLAGVRATEDGIFKFTTYIPNQYLIYTYPGLIESSRTSSYKFFPAPANEIDLVSLKVKSALQPGETYSTRSLITNPSILEMQKAGEIYPDWITQRYLQLPEDFSPRLVALAQDITAGKTNAYDKAEAITAYLRNEIEYVPEIPAPPKGADRLEWFLFDYKKGFCNYYATAEVLMLRSVGVPARMVVGYAQGERNQTSDEFTVRKKDAHAWPEVFFPGIGWVQFEPTASQLEIVRPAGLIPTPELDEEGNPRPWQDEQVAPQIPLPLDPALDLNETQYSRYFENLRWIIMIVIVVSAAGILYWQLKKRPQVVNHIPSAMVGFLEARNLNAPDALRNWALWSEQAPTARSFEAINQSLTWLGKPQGFSATPSERAAALQLLIPEAGQEISQLTAMHEAALYGQNEQDHVTARKAAWQIRSLTVRKIIREIFHR